MTYLQAVGKAIRLAKEKGVPCCVVEIDPDDDGGREIRVVRESYTETDEFEAYCGEIIAVIQPDGSGEDLAGGWQS